MRSLLGFIVFTAVFIAVLALVLVPIVVPPLVTAAVRGALPFGDAPLDILVDVDGLALARGTIAEIRVAGGDLVAGPARVSSLRLQLDDVRLDRQGFGAIDGAVSGVFLTLADGTPLAIDSIQLSGPSSDVRAVARISPESALRLAQERLGGAGVEALRLELVDGGVELELLGQQVRAALRVEGGSLVMASSFGGGAIVLFGPEAGDPWQLVSADVSPSGVVLVAAVDAAAVLERDRG
jgi:hypothetical protein